jgi:hypothetical protein
MRLKLLFAPPTFELFFPCDGSGLLRWTPRDHPLCIGPEGRAAKCVCRRGRKAWDPVSNIGERRRCGTGMGICVFHHSFDVGLVVGRAREGLHLADGGLRRGRDVPFSEDQRQKCGNLQPPPPISIPPPTLSAETCLSMVFLRTSNPIDLGYQSYGSPD